MSEEDSGNSEHLRRILIERNFPTIGLRRWELTTADSSKRYTIHVLVRDDSNAYYDISIYRIADELLTHRTDIFIKIASDGKVLGYMEMKVSKGPDGMWGFNINDTTDFLPTNADPTTRDRIDKMVTTLIQTIDSEGRLLDSPGDNSLQL